LESSVIVCLIRRQLLKVVGFWLLLVCVPLLAVGCPSVSAEVIGVASSKSSTSSNASIAITITSKVGSTPS